MNRVVLTLLGVLLVIQSAQAHAFAPPSVETAANSDSVYLVEVQSIDRTDPNRLREKITFSIVESLKGKSAAPLILTPYPDLYFDKYEVGSRWIFIHNPGGFKNGVGWAMKGDCEWLPSEVTQVEGKSSAQWLGLVDSIRLYLHDHPTKP